MQSIAVTDPPTSGLYVPAGHAAGAVVARVHTYPAGHAKFVNSGATLVPAGQNMPAGHSATAAVAVVLEAQ
jgi:hypothetical protein